MPTKRTVKPCDQYRDADGFCPLDNCWAGKPCPKTEEEASAAWEAVCDKYIGLREERMAQKCAEAIKARGKA